MMIWLYVYGLFALLWMGFGVSLTVRNPRIRRPMLAATLAGILWPVSVAWVIVELIRKPPVDINQE